MLESDQLELLRVLGESPERDWATEELACACQVQAGRLGAELAALEGRGLVRTTTTDAKLQARLGPKDPATAEALGRLLQFYRERPVTLIKAMYARANNRLRAFADAFRLRRQE